jgi:predicted dehydrogenase
MSDKVRIGIIGVGQIGKQHVARYVGVPEAEIVAVCDLREDEAQRVAQANGIPTVYTNYHDLLARDDIQAVDVCVHNHLHAPITVDALHAGKNVYCEKPMSWNYRDAKIMVDTAAAVGRKLHVQLGTIYTPEARAARRLICDGQLGSIYYARSSHYRRRGRPWVDGYGTAQFVQNTASGGGATLDMAVYHIARMMWLLDNPPVLTVSGNTFQRLDNMYPDRRDSAPYGVEELGLGLVRLGGGITYYMEEAWAVQSDQADTDHIFGTHAGLRVEPLGYFATLSDMEMDATFDVKQADWRWHQVNPQEAGYDDSQRHWIWALLGRVPLLDTAGLALKTSLISEGIYLSAHLGREVTAAEIEAAAPEERMPKGHPVERPAA